MTRGFCTRSAEVLALLTLAACSTKPAPGDIDPPDVGLPAPAAASASRFSVPLEYDITAVLRNVEQVVPHTFGSMDSVKVMGTDDHRHYAFEATRGPFTAFARGNLLHLRTTLSYTARGYFKPPIGPTVSAGCGSGKVRPRIVVEIATPLSLGEDWHLVSHASLVSVAAASTEQRDHCDVSIIHYDVTESVVGAARSGVSAQLRNIDRKVGTVDLSKHVAGWWKTLDKPIRLTDGVWLLLGPEKLSIGQVRGESRILTVPVSLSARPRIVTSTTEPTVQPHALPPLGHDSAAGEFHISLDGLVDYATASRQLSNALSAKSLTQSGHTITVTRAVLRPLREGRLSVAITFAGDARGVLELEGMPRLDHARDEVYVPDLDFDLRTHSKILGTYAWLKTDDLRAELRRRSRIPIAEALDRGRALLAAGLNRKLGDAATLSGIVDSVSVRELFVTRDGLMIRADAAGRAGLSVKQQ